MSMWKYVFGCLVLMHSFSFAQTGLHAELDRIVAGKKTRVGISVLQLGSDEIVSLRGNEKFPMQSVFKFHIALAVLDRVDKGEFSLTQVIPVSKEDVTHQLYSPIKDKYPNGTQELTLDSLIRYTVASSDNTGCDLLFKLLGGPLEVERFIKSKGITQVAIANTEEELQEDWSVQYRNWTTPEAAVHLLKKFAAGQIVTPQSTSYLEEVMLGTVTGAKRIKGLLPAGTPVAHKTGWSGRNKEGITAATNDIGLVFLPGGKVYAIAVFVSDSSESPEVNEEIIALAAKAAFDYYTSAR